MISRVPSCPDCGEPGKHVRGNHFRCSDPHCGAVWEEVGWTNRVAEEQAILEVSERLRGVYSLIAAGEEVCDNCGKVIKHAEKYCYDTSVVIDDPGSRMQPQRGKRYCVNCSLERGWLRMVKDTKTGKIQPVMFRLEGEVSV